MSFKVEKELKDNSERHRLEAMLPPPFEVPKFPIQGQLPSEARKELKSMPIKPALKDTLN